MPAFAAGAHAAMMRAAAAALAHLPPPLPTAAPQVSQDLGEEADDDDGEESSEEEEGGEGSEGEGEGEGGECAAAGRAARRAKKATAGSGLRLSKAHFFLGLLGFMLLAQLLLFMDMASFWRRWLPSGQ
jgi:hypothetical protein